MATLHEWSLLRYFRPKGTFDKWHNSAIMDFRLLKILDDFRHHINSPIIVTSGAGGTHKSTQSYHYQGKAVDIIVKGYSSTLLDLLLEALSFPFSGVGLYPLWKYRGSVKGGLHLDIRPENDTRRTAKWLGITRSNYVDGKLMTSTDYMGLTYENIKKHVRL